MALKFPLFRLIVKWGAVSLCACVCVFVCFCLLICTLSCLSSAHPSWMTALMTSLFPTTAARCNAVCSPCRHTNTHTSLTIDMWQETHQQQEKKTSHPSRQKTVPSCENLGAPIWYFIRLLHYKWSCWVILVSQKCVNINEIFIISKINWIWWNKQKKTEI